jgi:hypothetical protein
MQINQYKTQTIRESDVPLGASIDVSAPLAFVGVPSSSLISLPLAPPLLRRLRTPILTLSDDVAIAGTVRSTVPTVPVPFRETRTVGEEHGAPYGFDGEIGDDVFPTVDFQAGLAAMAVTDDVRPAGSVVVNVG